MFALFIANALASEPYETRSRTWFGGTVPSLALVGELSDGALYVDPAIAGDVNLRFGTPSGFVQPELRVQFVVDPGIWSGSAGINAVAGARFGRDHAWYGGLGAGVGTTAWFVAQAWFGYAFRIGDVGRVSLELMIGTMTTLTCRFEWSTAARK